MSSIRIEELRKYYGAVRALDGLTLNVEPGTVFGFLGPNGAGKSTTIRLLTGLAHPTGGRAWVAGVEIAQHRNAAARIGYLPEDPAFYTWMTPLELLEHVGRVFGMRAAQAKARGLELLEQVDLAGVRKRRIGGFSRGMRQRLGLAQALVNQPEVLFLDEPISALDPAGRKEVLEMIERLRGQCTVFMSTHILADVERVCDRVGIINKGKLVVEANQTELLNRYSLPAFELEVDPASATAFTAWLEGLRAKPWLKSITLLNGGSAARLLVEDVSAARGELLPLALQAGLNLRRYEVATPSLEDIFLRLVGAEAQP